MNPTINFSVLESLGKDFDAHKRSQKTIRLIKSIQENILPERKTRPDVSRDARLLPESQQKLLAGFLQ